MKKNYSNRLKQITRGILLLSTFLIAGSLRAQCTPLTVSALPVGGLVCAGSGVTLTASGLDTYTWTGGISNGAGFTLNANTSYTVTGTVNSGGCAGTYSRVVNVSVTTPPSSQAVSATPASVLCGSNVTVALASTQAAAAYYLRNDANNALITGPVFATGSALNIVAGNVTTATTFNVNAVNLTRSMLFDGVDDMAIISNTMSTAGDFTWEAWFKCAADGSIMSLSPASGNYNTGGKTMFIRSGKLSFDCYGIAYMEMPAYVTLVTDGNWHHAAITNKADYSSTLDRTIMYIDGQIVLIKNDWDITGSQGTGMVNKIGYTNSNFPATPAFNGSMDDVKFWSVERSQLDVIADMNACPPAATTGLDAFYTFEDGTRTTLSDNATGNRPGVLTNMSPSPVTAYNGREACSSCSTVMGTRPAVTISPLATQAVSALTPSFCSSGTTSIITAGSETGVNYYMTNSSNTVVTGPVAGTGSGLNYGTGALSSTTSYSVTARRTSGAINFDGVDDVVSVAQTPALAQFSTTPMTMEAWVYPTNITTIKSVIRKEGSYNLYLNNGRIYFEMYRNLGGGTNYTITLGQTIIPLNQWSHIAASWQGGIYADIFLNGNQEIIGGGSSTNNNLSNAITIGRATIANQPFAGKIDEIRIWNTARTAAQIKNNMRTCLTGSETGLLLYYKMNDAGTSVIDAAGGDNNGTLLNSNQATIWDSGVDNCGCSLQMPVTPTVTIYATPVISVNNPTTCLGSSVTIVPTGAGANGSYSITGGTFTVSPSSNTSYSVTATNSAGCVASNTVVSTVSVNALPTVSATSGSICPGKSFTIVPSGAASFAISGGTFIVTPSVTTSYTVTGTYNGCTNTFVTTVTVNASPTLAVNSATICSGNTVTIVPTGASTYTITGGNFVVGPNTTTSYSVTGTDSNGCISANAVSTVSVKTTPTVAVNNATICSGNSVAIVPSGATSYTISGGTYTVSPNTTTSYTVAGTTNGCISANAVVTVSVNATPSVTVNNTTICSGNSVAIVPTGAASYTISGGNYTVSPNSTTSYTVTGTTNGCISANAVSTISVNTTPSITVNSATICSGNSVAIVPTGAASYTIGGGSYTVSPNTTASYTVAGSTNGCMSAYVVATISVNTTPSITVNNATICSGNSVAIVPTGAASYTISGGTYTVSPNSTTSYTVTGSTNGCISANAVSTISVNATPSVTANNATICSGNSVAIVPAGAASYTISGGTYTVSPNSNTSYTVTGSTNGCISADAVSSISVNATPSVTVNNATICSGNSVAIVPTGAGSYTISGGTYTVSPNSTASYTVNGSTNGCISADAVSSISVNATPSVTVNNATICSGNSVAIVPTGAASYTISGGTYTVSPNVTASYTVTGSTDGCISANAVSTISVNATPTLTMPGGAICPGNSYTLSASGAGTYTYSGGSAIVSPGVTTTYSATGTGTNGCPAGNTAVATVSVVNTLTLSVSGATNVCSGRSTTLTVSGATTYTWSTGIITSTISLSPLTNTTYTVSGASGTCSNTAVVTLSVLTTPTVTANNATICAGSSVAIVPTGAASYIISGGNFTVTPLASTQYTVAGTAANGCISNSVVSTVSVNALPTLSVNSSTICSGASVVIAPTGATSYTITGASFTVSPVSTTSYSVTGSANGCAAANAVVSIVSVNATPTLSVNDATICSGASVVIVPAGGDTYSITGNSFTVTPNATTSYSITGTGTNNCVAGNTVVATVLVNITPSLSVNSAFICSGASVVITPTGAVSYSISGNSFTVSPTTDTSYSVTGTSAEGCTSDNAAVSTITVNALPTVIASAVSPTICLGETASLTASGASTYSWSDGQTGTGIIITPTATTIYTVTATDVNGCVNTAFITQNTDACVGIKTNTASMLNVNVYPNPNTGKFVFESSENTVIVIVNSTGQVVHTATTTGTKTEVNIDHLANGIYFINAVNNGKQHTVKMIKE